MPVALTRFTHRAVTSRFHRNLCNMVPTIEMAIDRFESKSARDARTFLGICHVAQPGDGKGTTRKIGKWISWPANQLINWSAYQLVS